MDAKHIELTLAVEYFLKTLWMDGPNAKNIVNSHALKNLKEKFEKSNNT